MTRERFRAAATAARALALLCCAASLSVTACSAAKLAQTAEKIAFCALDSAGHETLTPECIAAIKNAIRYPSAETTAIAASICGSTLADLESAI